MDCRDYLIAASRKIGIAQYHAECLMTPRDTAPQSDGLPPVPVQAHFEAVVFSVIAAVDQVAHVGIELHEQVIRDSGEHRAHDRPCPHQQVSSQGCAEQNMFFRC